MPAKLSYAWRIVLAFVVVDLNFKVLVGLTFIHVTGNRWDLLSTMLGVLAPIWLAWLAIVIWQTRPIDGRGDPAAIRRAGELCDLLPRRLATIWTLEWVGGFTVVSIVAGQPFDITNLCFLATLVSGPIPIAHALTSWLLTPCRRELERAARDANITIPKRSLTIRRHLLTYAICIASAPATFMASVGLSARSHMTAIDTVLFALLIGFIAVAMFAILNAYLVAAVLTRPVVDMTEVLRTVAERGAVQAAKAERLPQYQRDEIGVLVEVTNEMLDRLERTEAAREAAHAELAELTHTLEQRVVERTQQLEREQSQRHVIERELDLARQIQTSILPRRWDVDGLDIAAAMVTATEVGGDYYDILPRPNGGWIGIGDVSGHGVSAGLIMLMVQSITAALVDAFPHASPRELVVAIDRILFRNVRHRLETRDFVTFTLLRYDREGHLQFAGAHEDLIIWRAATGRCERRATPGPWIATTGNIAEHVVEGELVLAPGDLLVLYTDGITEARNGEREQFGMDRLCTSIEALARDESVEQIGARVIESVRAWCARQEDDMSIVVARQRRPAVRA